MTDGTDEPADASSGDPDGAGGVAPEPASTPDRRRVQLPGISSRAWEHPADRGALTALRELRGFDDLLRALSGAWNEKAFRLELLGGGVRVDHRQYERVYRIFAEAASVLDVTTLPELYVNFDRGLNSTCVGMSRPFIVVSSGAIELLDEAELRTLLGHELGHLRSGHAVYRTMLDTVLRWGVTFAWIPLGSVVLPAIAAAMHEWWRKAELSADRAGLLASQDPAAALRLSMKSAGGGDLSEIDTTAFLEQASEYDSGGDLRDSVLKLRRLLWRTHPLPVARAAELRRWVDAGEYTAILGGTYPRKVGDGAASPSADVKAAADHYRAAFRATDDPLAAMLRRVGEGGAGAGEWATAGFGKLRDWMGGLSNDQERRSGDDTPPSST
jgi:Zn-dependent protease with chaperone function